MSEHATAVLVVILVLDLLAITAALCRWDSRRDRVRAVPVRARRFPV